MKYWLKKLNALIGFVSGKRWAVVFARPLLMIVLALLYTVFCPAQPQQRTDSVTVPTSLKYKNAGIFKKLFLGRNYRTEWSTPVRVPVFYFSQSGLKIKELGGGQQTKSLQLEDRNGKKWVLRTVDKDVTLALPKGLRGTFAQKVVQDMISGAHPHAPLVVAELAKAAKIVAPDPVLYYVADDDGLKPYKHLFVGTLCFLEEREPTPDNADTKNTENMLEDILEENDHLVLQREVLKARLLDMLVADWDRHADQWRWGEKDSAGVNFYYSIPRDRDQAFFNSNGLLVTVARWIALKHLVGFRHNTNKVRKLNYKAWNFDRTFLNSLTAEDWQQGIQQFVQALPDAVIERAVKDLPAATYAISGKLVEEKLKSRRDDLPADVMRYYRFLSKVVTVNGTDEEEVFRIYTANNNLTVQVTNASGKRVVYQRSFSDAETKQIVLHGFGSADRFVIEEGASSGIRLVIHGGKGNDVYELKGRIRNTVIDSRSEENKFTHTSRTRKKLK